jgi:hypothetical protein
MDPGAEAARHPLIAKGEFRRMDPGAERFMHGADRLGFADIIAAQFLDRHHPRCVAEHLVLQPRLGCDLRQRPRPVRDVEMAATLRLAGNVAAADQFLEGLETVLNLGMQTERDIAAPARDPLRPRQPPGGILALPAIARAAAPGHPVGLEHHRLDAEFTGQENCAGKPGIARADDGDIGIEVAVERSVIGRRRSGGRRPVGRRIIAVLPGT